MALIPRLNQNLIKMEFQNQAYPYALFSSSIFCFCIYLQKFRNRAAAFARFQMTRTPFGRGGGSGEMANLTNDKGKLAYAIFLKSDISDIKEIDINNHFTIHILMPVLTLQSSMMIGCLEVGKLGRDPQIL